MKKEYFLAITALEEFWDLDKPLLFLGEWCLRFDRRSFWTTLDGHLVESYDQGAKKAHIIYDDIDKIYERILPIVANELNSVHETHFSVRYWRLVIGPWLQTYIASVYDRYERLIPVLKEHPNLITVMLSEDSFEVPQDTEDFINRIRNDIYNLQIYSEILRFLGKKFPCKPAQEKQTKINSEVQTRSWKQNLSSLITDIHRFLVIKLVSKPIVISNSYLSKKVEFKLIMNFFGRVFTTTSMKTKKRHYNYDKDLRKKLMKVSFGQSDFCKCLSSMLFADIPKCFVEGYRSTVHSGNISYPSSPNLIFSANSWWYDEVFKFWAATHAEKGTPLLGTPHGGDYAARFIQPSRKHEAEIVDYYYPWGLRGEKLKSKLIPMPAVKLMALKNIGSNNDKNGILWVTTSWSRYVASEFPYCAPEHYNNYLSWQKRFAEALSFKTSSAVCLRAHPADFGWDVVSRLKSCIPELKLDSPKMPLSESMSNCRLYVCDHLSTTYAEALSSNMPTILFWSSEANPLTSYAEQYFELLRSVGVLFDSPEAAAEAVDNIYEDIETWWNDIVRQEAVRIFTEKFCGQIPDAENVWIKELRRIDSSNGNVH
jgi:putative transferase (TIGR04331 family)